jgi:DNA-binding CsgD family transcriptional regulator
VTGVWGGRDGDHPVRAPLGLRRTTSFGWARLEVQSPVSPRGKIWAAVVGVAEGALVERDVELRRLRSLLDRAADGRGALVVVDGPAGIGKTRLLQETCEVAAGRGVRVLTARGGDLEREFAFGVVRQLFEPVVVDSAAGGRGWLLAGFAAYAEPVFASTGLAAEGPAVRDRSAAVLHGLYWLTRNLAERGRLLIAVDDAHWADLSSLLFLHYLARRMAAMPVVVVVSSRRGQLGAEAELVRRIAADASGGVLQLRPLTVEGTAELMRSLFGVDATDALCRACHGATGGNPFLIRELAAALLAEGLSTGADAAAQVGRLVPDAVARNVLVRLSRLGPATVRVARAVAVLGAGAELRHAAALAQLDKAEAAGAVDALVSADILSAGLPLEFAHPLLAEAVYADARPAERMLAHARAARLLRDAGGPPERVALQLLACEPVNSAWAGETLREAAREATGRGAPQTAARYLERALSEPATAADRRDLLLELGVAESHAALPPAADHLGEALRLSSDPGGRARVAHELAGLYNLLGRFGESVTVLEAAIDELGEADWELRFGLEAEAAVLAIAHVGARRRLAHRMAAWRAMAPMLAGAPGGAPLLAVIARELADTDGMAGEVAGYAERAFAGGRLLTREGPVLSVGASALVIADRCVAAETMLDAAISAARSRGSIQALRAALAARAFARNRRGQIAEAEADARLTLELSADEPSDPVRPLRLAFLADALIEQGKIAEAERLVNDAELARHDPDSAMVQPLADTHARLLLLRGRHREALAVLKAQLRWQRAWGAHNPGWTSTRSLAARAHYALDEPDQARALAAQDLDAARTFGAPRAIGIALRTIALVHDGPRLDDLRASAEVLEDSEAALELARTLVELGAALRRGGGRRDARDPLQRGLQLAHDCGAAPLAERARAELLAAGARPRRPRTVGRDALTPSERRVAAMAKDGLANREIAQVLFLSPKTVEMHLGSTYRKLGISSRRQLPRALDQSESTGE